jgi:hypothetical protein
MVERFVRLGDDLLAVLSNGHVITTSLENLVWQRVLLEIDDVLAAAAEMAACFQAELVGLFVENADFFRLAGASSVRAVDALLAAHHDLDSREIDRPLRAQARRMRVSWFWAGAAGRSPNPGASALPRERSCPRLPSQITGAGSLRWLSAVRQGPDRGRDSGREVRRASEGSRPGRWDGESSTSPVPRREAT